MNSKTRSGIVTTIGIKNGKNGFQLIGLDARGAIGLRQKRWRPATQPP